jgi:redox-sensitive bicupin YhaK (pirin superfamily)
MEAVKEGTNTMLTVIKSNERGRTSLDWLDSRHSFSFGDYYDNSHMGFGPLRVINEDYIAPAGGFGFHPHNDMEIITYIVDGKLQHKDSLGTGSVIQPGEIQKMSAGTGIVHSEFNASDTDPVHLLQIWIMPDKRGIKPTYEQKTFSVQPDEFQLLGSKDGNSLISINQSVRLYVLKTASKQQKSFELKPGASCWIQMIKGKCSVNGNAVTAGDGIAIRDTAKIEIVTQEETELLLFEIENQ